VDRICRFENLDGDLKTVCKQLGISQEPDLPQAKSGVRQDKRSYRDILSAGEREKIAELFRDEIELLGYEFWHARFLAPVVLPSPLQPLALGAPPRASGRSRPSLRRQGRD